MNRLLKKSGRGLWCAPALPYAQFGVLAVALLLAGFAVAQEAQSEAPNDPANNAAPPPTPNPSFAPGFIDALGQWIGESKSALDSQLKNTQDALSGIGTQATGVIKEAAG